MQFTKPSIMKLSRRAGVKSISDECYDTIRKIVDHKLTEVVKAIIVVNSEHSTKTIMTHDVYDALQLLNHKVTQSQDLNV